MHSSGIPHIVSPACQKNGFISISEGSATPTRLYHYFPLDYHFFRISWTRNVLLNTKILKKMGFFFTSNRKILINPWKSISNTNLYKKNDCLLNQIYQVMSFWVEHYTTKMAIIIYYLWPNSSALKICNQKYYTEVQK